jgi:hypothetical protein
MNRKDLDALNELYLSVYDGEQLNEAPEAPTYGLDDNRATRILSRIKNSNNPVLRYIRNIPNPLLMDASGRVKQNKPAPASSGSRGSEVNPPSAADAKKDEADPRRIPTPAAGSPPTRTPAGSPPPRPAASSTVLAKQKGVEGRLDKATGKFTTGTFSAAEKSRYSSVAAQNAARTSASSGAATPAAAQPKPAAPAVGKLGNTSFERRTPTSAELRAAQGARDKGASPEKALQAAQKTNLPTTGPTPAIPSASSVAADVAKANSPAVINRPAPAGSALAKQQAQQKLKPPTPGTGIMQNQSYEWPSAKTIRDIAGAYSSIYEAKKKVDQDQDGDNDFADVRIARMIASGVPKAKAIAMVKDKSYNEEVELWVNELVEEGYDLSDYTWDEMVEIYEATAMTKRGYDETEIRNEIAKSTGGGKFADKATALADRQTYGNKSKKAAREKLARTQRGDFRRTTSSNPGLHGYAYKSNDPAVKAKQAARGAQRGVLTPNEKKELNREAYAAYEFVASYLLENNFASTVDDANVIINNMSEGWFESIMEEKKPLPVAKMKRKESKLLDNEEGQLQALRTDVGSKERKARMKELQRFDNINSVRTSVAKRGGKQQHSMPEIGRYKPKDED